MFDVVQIGPRLGFEHVTHCNTSTYPTQILNQADGSDCTAQMKKPFTSLAVLGIHDPLRLNDVVIVLDHLDFKGEDAVDLLDEVLSVRRQLGTDLVEHRRRFEVAR